MPRTCQLIALVGLLLILSGCSAIVSSKPEIDGNLTAPCKPLPEAQIAVGDDIRVAAPKHLAIVAKMYKDCASQLTSLVEAVK